MNTTQSPRRRGARGGVLVVAVSSLVLALTACSGGPRPAGGATNAAASTQLTVGLIPIVDTGAFRLGVSRGFFREKGLEITVQDAQGGAAIVPAVLSGSNEIGFSNLSSLIVAREKNLPVRLIAPGSATTGDTTNDYGGIVVKAGSPLTSARDLSGRTVAVNTLKNIGDTTVRHAVEAAGGDPATIRFVEVAFPDMPGQLAAGNIDAAWSIEPYLSIMKGQGGTVIDYNLAGFDPNLQVAGYFTSTPYATANPGVVTAFQEALRTSSEYATAHPDELRAFLSTYTRIDPAVQKAVVLPRFPTSIDEAALQKLADEGQKYGMTAGRVDVGGLLR